MKSLIHILFPIIFLFPLTGTTQQTSADTSQITYRSVRLVITRIADDAYVHTSFLDSETFGKVACNGMVVAHGGEAIVFDTPTDDSSSAELIRWIKEKLRSRIKAVIPTHFHEDCVGGLKEFNKNNVPSYAKKETIELTKKHQFNVPANGFKDSLTLSVGGREVHARFFGEGHTRDNIVGYFPDKHIMFGGCLIKALNAGKGNLNDANVKEWSITVEKVKKAHPDVKIVIPGHGDFGDKALLDYTIRLFKNS